MADQFWAVEKQPNEKYAYTIEYTYKLRSGDSLATVSSATAIRKDTGVDVTAAFIDSALISGTTLVVTVKDGLTGIVYKVSTRVTTTIGDIFEADTHMAVSEK